MPDQKLKDRLALACQWITDVARVKKECEITDAHRKRLLHDTWLGAIKGEYSPANRKWAFFCPIWHTGQAVKALVMASEVIDTISMDTVRKMADFIIANQVTDGEDEGLILGYEDYPDIVNTSAQFESLGGLWALSKKTGDERYSQAALKALDWTLHKSFLPDEGLFRDHYNPQSKQFVHRPHVGIGRPLLDDGAYIQAYRHTGEKRYLDIAVRTAERLLKDEMPPGNWLKYQPCRRQIGSIHPRHAYWWGRPMLQLWETTGDADCLFAFQRSTDWYARAVRTDGGMFRDTRLDFSTSSFGHSTSASACAMMMFMDDYRENNAGHRIPLIKRTLDYCLNMQFTDTQDPNLKGCILEKIMPPDGTDRCPFHIRDVGTIFFVQALSQWLSAEAEQHLAAGITP